MLSLRSDTLVHQRYRVKKVVAGGGMSFLYEAFDEQLERVVAIKQNGNVLSAELFLNEAKLLGRLRHPHLPAAIDVFEENAQQFFVMEFIEGPNLDQLLTERKKFSVNEIIPWALQILDALDYLHTQEPPIIHRDIKPGNLILSHGAIFLVDFGISKDTKHTQASGSGTHQYASPEHTYGSTTVASDLYSLSATLYHLLTGRPVPNATLRSRETQRMGRDDPLVPAHVSDPSIGEAVSAILAQGLSLDVSERPHSAAAMRAAFEKVARTVSQLDTRSEFIPAKPRQAWLQQLRVRIEQWRNQKSAHWLWGISGILVASLIFTVGLMMSRQLQPLVMADTDGTLSLNPAAAPSAVATLPPTMTLRSTTNSVEAPTFPNQPTTIPTEVLMLTEAAPFPVESPIAFSATTFESLPPASQDTIRIVLQSPLTGEWEALGTGIKNGAELAVMQQQKRLEELGYDVEFIALDDQDSTAQGKINAHSIAADPATLCVIGHFNSEVTLAVQPIYADANLVQISPGSTNPAVTDSTSNVWRVVGRDDVQGVIAAQFASEILDGRSVYIIHDGTTTGRAVARFFRNQAEVDGMQVLAFSSYDDAQQTIDFSSYLDEIQNRNPDVIYFAGSYLRAAGFFKQARERGISAHFIGPETLDNAELGKLAGEAVDKMYFTTVAAPFHSGALAEQFNSDYRVTFGQEAPPFSHESYDAAAICIDAIDKAARESGGIPSREQVIEAMRTLDLYQGVSGNYRFNENGDPLSVAYFVVQVNAQNWTENRVVEKIVAEPPS